MNNTIKLHAYLAHAGVASRRKSEELIKANKVKINNQLATIGQRIDPVQDQISVSGQIITTNQQPSCYFLIYKPVGYVSTTSDEQGRKTVLELLPAIKERVYPVGRLDIESEGLLLITNDGELAYKMTHPKFQIPKTYHVTVKGHPTSKALNHLRRGVKLSEGYTQPAVVDVIDAEDQTTTLSIKIHEGWNRQVRRMLERVGYDTIKLVRVQFGPYSIDDLRGEKVMKVEPVSLLKSMSIQP